MVAVPFDFFFLIELTVILFDGAAAIRHGPLAPATRFGFGEVPEMFTRPTKLLVGVPMLPQNRYWGFTATPQALFPVGAAFGMKLLSADPAPPLTDARPTVRVGVAQYRNELSTA